MSLGEVDDAQFQAWANRVKAKVSGDWAKRQLSKTSKEVGTQGLRLLKSNTPVDSGKLRRSWEADGPNFWGRSIIITFTNNTEYASYVENGHRTRGGRNWVAGQFFMKRSLMTLQGQLPSMLPAEDIFEDLLD